MLIKNIFSLNVGFIYFCMTSYIYFKVAVRTFDDSQTHEQMLAFKLKITALENRIKVVELNQASELNSIILPDTGIIASDYSFIIGVAILIIFCSIAFVSSRHPLNSLIDSSPLVNPLTGALGVSNSFSKPYSELIFQDGPLYELIAGNGVEPGLLKEVGFLKVTQVTEDAINMINNINL